MTTSDDEQDENASTSSSSEGNGKEEEEQSKETVEEVQAETRALVSALASCRPDVWMTKKRNELVEKVQEYLKKHAAARVELATWKGLRCSSLHGYKRVAPLYVLCLQVETEQLRSKEETKQVLLDLCICLTRILYLSRSVELVDQCIQELTSTSFSADAQAFLATVLHENLIANSSSSTPKDNRVTPITGAALGAALDAMAREYNDWCTGVLLGESLTNFPATTYLKLAHGVVRQHISTDVWKEIVSPALLLKIRSHPDKALETVLGWIQGIPDAVLEQDDISNDWMTTVLDKHILAAGAQAEAAATRKETAQKLLLTWTSKSPAAWSRLAQLLATKKTTLAAAREACYGLWRELAIQQMTCPDKEMPNLMEVIGEVIRGILAFLPKETNADTRLVGREALVEWIVVAKRQQEAVGYDKALEFVRPSVPGIATTKGMESSLISLLVKMVHPDLLESILVDLWQENAQWTKSIESIVTMAATRKAVHVDGLVLVYLCLLHADQSGQPIPAVVNKVLSVGSAVNRTDPSFVYSQALIDSVAINPLLSMVLPRTIALYLQLASKHQEGSSDLFPSGKVSLAARTLAACVLHPNTTHDLTSPRIGKDQYPSNSIVASLEIILTYQPHAAPALVEAILEAVNAASLGVNEMVLSLNATKEARESQTVTIATVKGQGSQHAAHRGFDPYTVRRVGRLLAHHCGKQPGELLARVLVLMHVGSSLRSEGHQRAALILNTLNVIREAILPNDGGQKQQAAIADEITRISTQSHFSTSNSSAEIEICSSIHRAGLSLLQSLGGVAANFSPEIDDPEDADMKPYVYAQDLCLLEIATRLSSRLDSVLDKVENLAIGDIDLYLSPIGSLCIAQEDQTKAEVKKVSGKRLTEDEEWEQQMKRELAEKKKSSAPSYSLSDEDQKVIAAQDQQREQLANLLTKEYARSLDSIRYLASSDIEIGNAILPECSASVLRTAVSACPALKVIRSMRAKSYETLKALASCVYEIDEVHAPTIAHALILSCRTIDKSSRASEGGLEGCALPSPCAPAACVVYEMEKLHNTLSGASFAFLFPVLRACLLGPRTPVGCDAALKVLERHTALLFGDDADGTVTKLRRDMIACVLELLKHDRAQSFRDPTAFETLSACCRVAAPSEGTVVLSTAELAPLLDERGALGKRNCRLGSMIALARIAEDHQMFVKSNPLIENRLWLNCFDEDDEIRDAARKAWALANGVGVDEGSPPKPSPLYAAPLLPLLSHPDASIANAAADAFANGLAIHSGSVGRNIEILCKAYIESVPSPDSDVTEKSSPPLPIPLKATKPSVTPSVKKKSVALSGLPKKKAAAKKSALDVAGIGRPKAVKTTKTKSATHAALLKPKVERTLDDAELANQFKTVAAKQSSEEKDSPSRISVRLGVLGALAAVTRLETKVAMDEATLNLLTSFLIAYGIADGDEKVKSAARDTLRDIVASNGGSDEAIKFLLPHLESVLKTGVAKEEALGSLSREKIPKDISASDRRKEGAVVALGSVALHLKGPEYETRVDDTIDMLIAALNTPSEDVQLSVADALSKLMKKGRTQERVEDLLNKFLRNCLHGDSLAVRRGAAYGLSAAIKGSGIATLKKYEIVKNLDEACASGSSSEKEGALFAIELLSSRLGLLFEPYVIVLLPSLLKSFSDSSDYVRKAASNTVSIIMSKLSAHGVKLVMPAVLEAFDDAQWRTKQASIHMLGAMSHLAPKQLASALPKVVPKLTEAFSDTHPKVKGSAQEALDEISNVVRNPEISSISSTLMKALTDPADYTIKALEVLIETEFLHAIDAPSLALIVPILHRGLRDRGATTKRFAALISANITTMVNDAKEMIPYLPTLLPDLQSALLDPIPDVRSTAAKAMGSLTRSLGDQILPELRPWLVSKLRDPACSSAERSGAAQGLTEVIIVSGTEVVDDTMRNEILPLHSHPEPSTREGVLWMLSFLPPALGQNFTSLIDISLPALIGGLSDESEPVRDVALRAGRVLIRSHGKHHTDKILPSLEAGLCDEDHRIRVASLSLLGDLLSMIGGTSVVKGEGDTQDDIRRAERAQAQIALALGADTRRRVFSSLYIARSDSVHQVRQSALQVWKTVVSVTARTLRDILPVLVSRIVDDLASGDDEKTTVAGRCLGDVVSKLGDSVLPQIIPVLRNALSDGDEHTKRGVCVGLTEVISCSTKDQILRFFEIIVKLVQDALSDDSPGVRTMAASSFQSLYSIVGSRAFDEVVPSLLVALENGEDEASRTRALNGLIGILSVRSRELLPYIIPRLIQRPFTVNHATALAGIVEVTGSTIYTQFSAVIPAILGELSELDQGDERTALVRECSKSVCRYVDQAGVNSLVSIIASNCSSDRPALRRESCRMFEDVVIERAEKADFYDEIPIMIREMLYRLNDEEVSVLKANHAALSALSKQVPAEELVKNVEFMRNLLASMVSDARRRKGGVGDGEFLLPGFNIAKGLEPLIPIYQRGILYGTPTIREVSAAGLGEVISLTSNKFLAGPLIVKMTGPLLRIVGGRNPSNVKVAILKTLGLILVKGGPALKAFVAQFQTTFVKALSDPSRQVRVEAIEALSLLMPLSTRVDPLIKELIAGSLGKNVAEGLAAAAVQTATLEALAVVLDKGGAKAKLPASVSSALEASQELIRATDEGIRESAAKVMGAACALSGVDTATQVLEDTVIPASKSDSSADRHGAACAIHYILASEVGSKLDPDMIETSLKEISVGFLYDDKSSVREAGCVALLAVVGRSSSGKAGLKAVEPELLKIMGNTRETMDVHRALACGLCVALLMVEPEKRLDFMGVNMVDACLKLAMSGAQRVQFAYSDVLWLVLDVAHGQGGLDRYADIAVFENVRSMKSLHSKVLIKINEVTCLD